MKLSKKRKIAEDKLEEGRQYTMEEASALVKEVTKLNFDASIDVHVRLGVDPRQADQQIRGTVTLPHGTGKTKRVLVLCGEDKVEEAKAAGADHVGLDEYVDKITAGWTDIDVVIATPDVMPKIAKIGRILGPRGLMPNPKVGTVTPNISQAIEEVKKGKVAFKVDKYGIIHSSIGRVSFSKEQINDNASELILTLFKMKPSSAKGIYIKSISMVSTMSPGIDIDPRSIEGVTL